MTPEQCLALVAADTRVREAARDVVKMLDAWAGCVPEPVLRRLAGLAMSLAEFDRAEKEAK